MDVFQLLKKDHQEVKDLFQKMEPHLEKENKTAHTQREKLFAQLNAALTLHTRVEEELVYPALVDHKEVHAIVLEGLEEHRLAKELQAELTEMPCDSDEWAAKCKVLIEMVEHHVKEEEKEMFPDAKKVLDKNLLQDITEKVIQMKEAAQGDTTMTASKS